MSNRNDFLLGALAVKRGYMTAKQLAGSLYLQENLAAKGQKVKLGQILLRRDLITKSQPEDLILLQGDLRAGERKKTRSIRRFESER